MGVPGFYRWLVQRYPLVRRRLNDISRPKIDNFYVDFNCIVYNALRLAPASHPFTSLFQEICRYLDLLVQVTRPQQVLYIAVDGPAPFAKCAQQRSRRFVAARDATGGSFDTTSISVGTEFMELLNQFLMNFIKEKTTADAAWKNPQVIYSSHRVPGEGEHKFFNYIRTQTAKGYLSPNITHCVYSPDADLIFLGLQTRLPYFYILREWDCWVGPHENVGNGKLNKLKATDADFEMLSLSIAREFLKLDYPDIPDVNRIVDDFAAFSFLIGNDFIPHFPDISIQSGTFETIIETYQSTLMKQHIYLIEDGKINKNSLRELLIATVQKSSQPSKKGKGPTITIDPNVDAQKYLKEKYPEKFDENPEALEKELAFAALDSFDWVLEYYTKGCPSWSWCYPFYYAPPVTTIAKYCTEHKSNFNLDRPPMPVEQLLCILPPKSANLLPEAARTLMFEPSPLAKFYPEKFDIDLNGRKFEHEGVVLIPLVNIEEVREEVSKILDNLSPEERTRNTKMEELVFENGDFHDYDIEKDFIDNHDTQEKPNGIPSLYNGKIPFRHTTEVCKINIFNRPSNAASILLHINNQKSIFTKASDVAAALLNKPVLVNWPYLRPALVTQVFDRNETYPKDSVSHEKKKNNSLSFEQLPKTFKETLGIDIKETTNVILVVRLLASSRIEDDQYRFMRKIYYPYQLSVNCQCVPSVIHRFATPKCPKLENESLVVILEGEYAGRIGKALSSDNEKAKIQLYEITNEPPNLQDLFENDKKEWRSIDDIIEKLKIGYDATFPLLSNLPVSGETDANLAFTAFSERKVLDGFVRKVNKQHEFTKEFIIQLGEYAASPVSGDLIQFLQETELEKMRNVNPADIWPFSPSERKNKVKELMAYMRDTCCSKYYLIDESVNIISQTTLQKIENRIVSSPVKSLSDGNVIEENLSNLIWPRKQKEFIQNGEIGSRVVNISYTGSIPFGETGTVVGFDTALNLYHIVLDNECTYGTTLRKRLSTKRGYIAKPDDLFFY
ncbi:XRN 5'-3' exonuclease N-terminus family protein [Tritrichomonas foetus]|uniref:XRN 5'-3' exonuclease N-terminus family protein n=1 Tax=Tritrichomonas foetus TaxID=1144522 RepID=A0A1J4KWS9_9EUKA|nr:XRN 5'-3' exonuclease N-terminus family protein [Tritrichomonas foetus]|eukprot:OHT14158.1 XRN 5'-3' exonuclease N-terminus family protein [Tritrichomonas foetus]